MHSETDNKDNFSKRWYLHAYVSEFRPPPLKKFEFVQSFDCIILRFSAIVFSGKVLYIKQRGKYRIQSECNYS